MSAARAFASVEMLGAGIARAAESIASCSGRTRIGSGCANPQMECGCAALAKAAIAAAQGPPLGECRTGTFEWVSALAQIHIARTKIAGGSTRWLETCRRGFAQQLGRAVSAAQRV